MLPSMQRVPTIVNSRYAIKTEALFTQNTLSLRFWTNQEREPVL